MSCVVCKCFVGLLFGFVKLAFSFFNFLKNLRIKVKNFEALKKSFQSQSENLWKLAIITQSLTATKRNAGHKSFGLIQDATLKNSKKYLCKIRFPASLKSQPNSIDTHLQTYTREQIRRLATHAKSSATVNLAAAKPLQKGVTVRRDL